jgi:hypothetical protein
MENFSKRFWMTFNPIVRASRSFSLETVSTTAKSKNPKP